MKLKMYFLMLALGVCGAAMQSCDDDDDNLKVPEKLQSAFSQKYPEASPKWKTRGNYYIADFQDQNYESEAWFTFDAVWLMTETDLPYAALPEAVKNAFQNSEYGQWRLDDVEGTAGRETVVYTPTAYRTVLLVINTLCVQIVRVEAVPWNFVFMSIVVVNLCKCLIQVCVEIRVADATCRQLREILIEQLLEFTVLGVRVGAVSLLYREQLHLESLLFAFGSLLYDRSLRLK